MPATDELDDDLSAQIRFGPRQHGLLAVLIALVGVIAAVGYQADRQLAQDTEALAEQLQLVSGNMVSLERQVLTHALLTERWADGVTTEDELTLSRALVERQRRVTEDEARQDSSLAPLLAQLTRSLERIDEMTAGERPEEGSAADVALQAAVDDSVSAAKRLFDFVEVRNLIFLHALEEGLSGSRQKELIVAALFVVLVFALLGSMRGMLRRNYEVATTTLRREQSRYETARARREEAEQQLRQAQKLESVGQLAAGIAHEINTPMQYIGDNTHFLKATITRLLAVAESAERTIGEGATEQDRLALAEAVGKSKLPMLAQRAPKAADDALSGVENVSRIIKAMKRFSHPGSEHFEPVDVNDAITTTMTVCRNEWRYSADIETDLAADLPVIEGRLGSLNQVWLNMIVNATHAIADAHGDDKGVITITTASAPEEDAVRVSISDNGSGIAAEHLDRIFDHFFTTKDVGQGTGQGLAIAHQVIVSEHNGALAVDSSVGRGTTFTITLPTTQPVGELVS